MYSTVNENPVHQAKCALLSDVPKPWKTQLSCITITIAVVGFLLITYLCFEITLLQLPQSVFVGVSPEEQEKNVEMTSWRHNDLLHSESTKEDWNTHEFSDKQTGKAIVCYYTIPENVQASWKLMPSHIDPHICTHIIVGFATILNCSLNIGENTNAIYKKVVELKTLSPKLKVMISVGGRNDFQDGFSQMVKNHMNRKTFIRSVLNITKVLQMDGLDLDWEFPSWPSNDENQKLHFAQLIKELRKEFNHSGRELLLSVAVASPQAIIDQSYIVSDMALYAERFGAIIFVLFRRLDRSTMHVDFINLMAYDYHFYIWYFPVTDLNAPLYRRTTETGYLSMLNVNFSAQYWVAKGMPRDKIIVGIPTYGHSYRLKNSLNHNLGAPANDFGSLGFDGFVPYPIVCQFLRDGATRIFESESRVPYAYKNNEWISYDDIDSIYYKAEWIRSNNFKGAMIFSLNVDDWNGTCVPNETFPLTRLLTNILRKSFND